MSFFSKLFGSEKESEPGDEAAAAEAPSTEPAAVAPKNVPPPAEAKVEAPAPAPVEAKPATAVKPEASPSPSPAPAKPAAAVPAKKKTMVGLGAAPAASLSPAPAKPDAAKAEPASRPSLADSPRRSAVSPAPAAPAAKGGPPVQSREPTKPFSTAVAKPAPAVSAAPIKGGASVASALLLDKELDARFAEATAPAAKGRAPSAEERAATAAADAAAVRATFLDVAGVHLQQVRDVMIELRDGGDAKAALGPAMAAIEAVEKAAEAIGDADIRAKLGALREAIQKGTAQGAPNDASRKAMIAAYGPIAALSPDRLDLEKERSRRDPIIVRSLLQQVPALEGPGVRRLFAAGLGTLPALLKATAPDIEATAGVDGPSAKAIEELLGGYRRDHGATSASLDRGQDRRRLRALLEDLRREHEAFERAASMWSDASLGEKRLRRETRRRVLLQIDIVLARLGAAERVDSLDRIPVNRRIELLATWAADESAFGSAR